MKHYLLLVAFVLVAYMTSATTYYVSQSTGKDSNSGTSPETPWQSLKKVNAHAFSPGDQILFKRGNIWRGYIDVDDFGTPGNPIVYGAYGTGYAPVIIGGGAIKEWELYEGNIYKASVPLDISNVFIDFDVVPVSRYPDSGFINIDNVSSETVFSQSELALPNGASWKGATAILRMVDWSFEARKVRESSGTTVDLETAPRYDLAADRPFFMINSIHTLDGPNQWAYDDETMTVYLWTPNGDSPENYLVSACAYENCFVGTGVQNVTIQDLFIYGFKKNGVLFNGTCNNVTVDNCTIIDCYESGVFIFDSGESQNIQVTNNTIYRSNRSGIRIAGNNCTISANDVGFISLLKNIGLTAFIDPFNTATGIHGYPVTNSVISNNVVSEIGYNGIMFWGENTVVENNSIDQSCLTLQDGGGIYTHREEVVGSIIRNNIVSNSGPGFSKSSNGIYLDDAAVGVTVEGNTCFGNNGNGLFLHNNADIIATGNTLYDNNRQLYVVADNLSELKMLNNYAANNILYSTYGDQFCLELNDIQKKGLGLKMENNFYGSPINPKLIVVDFNQMILSKFQEFPDWGDGARELPQLLDHFIVTDTLSDNLIENGDFLSNNSFWYGGEWVTGVLDGGSHKRTATSATSAIQHSDFDIPGGEEKQYFVNVEYATDNTANPGRVHIGDLTIGYVLLEPMKYRRKLLFKTSEPITGERFTISVDGKAGDVFYIDNVEMYEVNADTIDPRERSKLFYNDTELTKTIPLEGSYWNLNKEILSGSISLPPYSSQILVKRRDLEFQNQSPVIKSQSFTVDEIKQEGDLIGQVVATDPDAGQTLTYSIISGNDENLFSINESTGELFAQSEIKFVDEKIVSLTVQVKDNARFPAVAKNKVTITILATETDNQPPVINDQAFEIPNIIKYADFVGQVIASDPDEGSELTYSIVSGNEDGLFYLFPLNGGLYVFKDHQFTTSTTIELVVEVTDNGTFPLSDQAVVTISTTVTEPGNQNQNPVISAQSFDIPGEVERGEFVGQVVASDPDANDTLTYRIKSGNDENLFFILPDDGVIRTNSAFQFSTNRTIDLVIEVTDDAASPLSAEATVSINIIAEEPVNQSPVINDQTFVVDEIKAAGDFIGQVIASDADAGQSLTYSIESGNDENLFSIDASTGELSAATEIQFSSDKTVVLSVMVTDDASTPLSAQADVTINIKATEKENQSPVINPQAFDIQGAEERGEFVGQVVASDPDAGDTLTFRIKSGNNENLFFILPDDGVIRTNAAFQFSTDRTIDLVIEVTDDAASPLSAEAIISINIMADEVTPVYTTENISICEGESYEGWNEPGVYERTLQTAAGADSIVTTTLTVNPVYEVTENVSILEGESYNGWTSEGVYTRTLSTINGCDSIVNTNLTVITAQQISLTRGWNIFSTYLVPDDPDMHSVLQDLLENNVLVKVEDENYNTFEQTSPGVWTNNIGELSKSEGYRILVSEDCTLTITGEKISLPFVLDLKMGNNIISFPSSQSVDAMEVVQPLIDQGVLMKVQDESGYSIENWGIIFGWTNMIGNFSPGEGYNVFVAKNCELTILDSYSKSSPYMPREERLTNFKLDYTGNGYNHMNLYLDLSKSNLKVGDEVAAFDGDICVGAVKLTDQNIQNNYVELVTSYHDEGEDNGFTNGSPIILKAWSSSEANEFQLQFSPISGNLNYNELGSTWIQISKALAVGVDDNSLSMEIEMYPNPTSSKVTLEFSAYPDSETQILITDMTGKRILSKQLESNREEFDMQSYPNGIYLVHVIVDNKKLVKKLVKR